MHNHPSKLSDPGNRSFNDPSAGVSAHPSAILASWMFAMLAMLGSQKNFFCQFIPEFITPECITVVSFVPNQLR
jgi:hypothetical protein